MNSLIGGDELDRATIRSVLRPCVVQTVGYIILTRLSKFRNMSRSSKTLRKNKRKMVCGIRMINVNKQSSKLMNH